MKTFAALLLTLVLLPACHTTPTKNYFVNRGGDLTDILRGHVMWGKGIALKLEVTRLLHLGGGWWDAQAWGLSNREVGGWHEQVGTWGLILGEYHERDVYDIDRVSGSYGWRFAEEGGTSFHQADPDNPLDLLTVRADLMLFVGIDLEVRVGEVIDFVAGIFQFDPANDDNDYTSVIDTP